MKTKFNILKYGIIAWSALIVISCDKEETETDFSDDVLLEEGFMSSTNNFDSEMVEAKEILTPLLHRSYDGSLSVEEAEKLFRKEAIIQQKAVGQTNKISNRFNFSIRTNTGNGRWDGTDGSVKAQITFLTDKGVIHREVILNNPGNDRVVGGHDFYEYVIYMPNIKWVEIKNSLLWLQGTDGWNVHTYMVFGYANEQTPALPSDPDTDNWITYTGVEPSLKWLDNATDSGWDWHYAQNSYGRIVF